MKCFKSRYGVYEGETYTSLFFTSDKEMDTDILVIPNGTDNQVEALESVAGIMNGLVEALESMLEYTRRMDSAAPWEKCELAAQDALKKAKGE